MNKLAKMIFLSFLMILISLNSGCKTAFDKEEHLITAKEAKVLSNSYLIEARKYFLHSLLTKIIPEMASNGKTQIWLSSDEFVTSLNSDDAKTLIKLGYKVEMCVDIDRIAYVKWD